MNAGGLKMKNDKFGASPSGIGRRELMKLGVGAVAAITTLEAKPAAAQQDADAGAAREGAARGGEAGRARETVSRPDGLVVRTGAGYKNDSGRAYGNGPMDEPSRRLVSFVQTYTESNLTDTMTTAIGNTMLDTVTAAAAGFDSDAGRLAARIGRANRGDLSSTIFGYGVVTNPESATFANSSMVRNTDYNDGDPGHGGHASVIVPGILAIGEAVHSTGPQVMIATAIGYEVLNGLQAASRGRGGEEGGGGGWDAPYEGVATALAAGKLLGLNEDQLANALSLALVPHMPMSVTHVGALSMWKGCHSAIGARNGVYAALLAREGMTGPAQPFEERGGLYDHVGTFKELQLPVSPDGRFGIESFRFKRYPAEGNAQATLLTAISPIREFTTVDNIESINLQVSFGTWQEICDPPKWDPRNRETADHSFAYLMAVALTDGEVYLNAFENERYIKDEKLRSLMGKITAEVDPAFNREPQARTRITVRTKDGKETVQEVHHEPPITHDEIVAKFERICAYRSVPKDQKDRTRTAWLNLKNVRDIAEPVRDLAKFGKPMPI
jgi:2-methylcitrate dehydratase